MAKKSKKNKSVKKKPGKSRPAADGFDDALYIRGQKAAAEFLKVSCKTVQRYKNVQGMPMHAKGWYIKKFLTVWHKQAEGEDTEISGHRHRDTIAVADLRETKVKLQQLELARMEGTVHNVADCEKRSIEKILAVKTAMLGMGRKLAPGLVGKTAPRIKKKIDDEVKAIIRVFSGE